MSAKVIRRSIAKFAVAHIVLAGILFGLAGRVDWTGGWIQLALSAAVSLAGLRYVTTRHPDLAAERARIFSSDRMWDRILTPVVAVVLPVAILAVAALDARFGWSAPIPAGVIVLAVAVDALGMALVLWAMRVNKFFSSVVRIQRDRGHRLVTDGPYQWIRHPGYAGWIPAILATAIVLESLWALVPAGLVVVLIVLRAALEDRYLQGALEGYADYARRVRWRLVPGLW